MIILSSQHTEGTQNKSNLPLRGKFRDEFFFQKNDTAILA